MQSYTARQAVRRFSALLGAAKTGPVAINKHGQPAAVLISPQLFAECWKLRIAAEEGRLLRTYETIIAEIGAGRHANADRLLRDTNRLWADRQRRQETTP